jgi:hypothetical protein
MSLFSMKHFLEVNIKVILLSNIGFGTKVVVSILDLYLVLLLSMICVHFKDIGECASRWVVEHTSHDKVSGLGSTTLVEPILYKNYEHRSMWSFAQAKFAVTLIQKWPYHNEVIDLHNKNTSKKYHIKSATV